jgi:ABC-type phosphate/phosphonate transport system permease subunit
VFDSVRYYVALALLQAAMQALTNASMKYLDYPAKMLFKSSRMVPTMLFGAIFQVIM